MYCAQLLHLFLQTTTPNTLRMITIRNKVETGIDTGRELLNWYIIDPGDLRTF